MGSGFTAFGMVDLSTNIDMFSTTKRGSRQASAALVTPDQFYYMATNQAAYNYNALYSGLYDSSVHNFVADRLRLGTGV